MKCIKPFVCAFIIIMVCVLAKCMMNNCENNKMMQRFVNSTKKCGKSIKKNASDFAKDVAQDASELATDCKKDISNMAGDIVDGFSNSCCSNSNC